VNVSHNSDIVRAALAAGRSHILDETGIYIEGDKKIIPERYRDNPIDYVMELNEAIKSLARNVQVTRYLNYRVWDVAVVMERYFRDAFGMSLASMAALTEGTMSVVVNANGDTLSVPMGTFDVDFLHGSLSITRQDSGTLLTVTTPLRYKSDAESFLDIVTEEMVAMSIYKGEAITYGYMPTFYDLDSIDSAKVIYPADVMVQLEADIWSRIRYRERLAAEGVDFGGAVLLHGKYGNGKTLAAGLTAQISVAHGVTFIKGSPGDSPEQLKDMAYQYEPAVIFLEDADVFLSENDPAAVSEMLDTFDSLDTKGRGVLVVFTTNHVERIHEGMLRPGRLNAVIEITGPDDDARERFIRSHIAPDMIDPELDMGPINESMADYTGAYVVAAIDRSKVYAYSRNKGFRPDYISTQDLVNAAMSLRSQHTLHLNAGEGTPRNRLDDALRAVLVPSIVEPITNRIEVSDTTRLEADDLHAIIAHNLKNYLDGQRVLDEDGDTVFEVVLGHPFYK
jgi:transitional endoplasmic reticulum ATPase